MPTLKVAHIHEQGQNMILFPLDGKFGQQSDSAKNGALSELEWRANAAGLAGSAVAFWQHGGRTNFLGPRPWHPFLKGLSLNHVLRMVNESISW